MIAARIDNTIHCSADVGRALTGEFKGYRVTLHALPQFVFHVDAQSVDQAQRAAFAVANTRGAGINSDAATIQRIN